MKFEKYNQPNGMRVILAPMGDTETVTVMLSVGTGSRYETRDINGISHFLEHMFFKGTEKRPTTLVISEELDGIGGEYNAFTSKDWTSYYAKVDSKHLNTALDVISDMLQNSLFQPEEIEREKGTILQEINMYEDQPGRIVGDYFENLLYKDHPLGWDVLGTKGNIKNMTRQQFIDYMKSQYVAKNMVLVVAGKINPEEIKNKIENFFNKINEGEYKDKQKINEKQQKPEAFIREKKTDQTHFVLGVRSYDMFHPDRYVLSVIANLLGGNMSSRLFIEVRERRGLAYRVNTFLEEYHDAGYLATHCGVEHENLEEALKVILNEYRKISEEKVSEKELNKAKEYLKAKLVMGLETSDETAAFLVQQEVLKRDIEKPSEISERIDAVTADDVLRVAKDIFQNNKLNVAIIGPHQNSQNIESILKLS